MWSVHYPKWVGHTGIIDPTFLIKAELIECKECEDELYEDEDGYEEPNFELAFKIDNGEYYLVLNGGHCDKSRVNITNMKLGDIVTLEAYTSNICLSLKIELLNYTYIYSVPMLAALGCE